MLEPNRFRSDQNFKDPIFHFDAFSLREPLSTPDQVRGMLRLKTLGGKGKRRFGR